MEEEGQSNNAGGGDRHEAATHPLQDVPLHKAELEESMTAVEPQQQQLPVRPNRKENWVKFDDDVNETGERNHNSNNNDAGDADNMNATRGVTAAAVGAEATNRLSPLPPPTASTITRARPRTPTESKQSQLDERSVALVAPVPVQRTSSTLPDVAPAVLTTESTHVNLNAAGKAQQQPHHQHQQIQQQQHQKSKASNAVSTTAAPPHTQPPHHSNNGAAHQAGSAMAKSTSSPAAAAATTSVTIPVDAAPPMRTIELSTGRIREGFANGDVIVTLLPANTKWPWITPAIFRPELVPEELMAQGLTLTVEDYVNAMETLVNDYRFTVYNICYKRILVCWIFFAFAVLLTLLFSGLQGVALFSLGVGWLFLNAAAIFFCMWVKLRLARGLEKCLARVNRQLMKHKILLVLDDRGRISCHKVNLCFMYFDATQCVNFLNEFLEQTEQNGGEAIKAGWEAKLDIDLNDIVIQGTNPVRLSRKQERGMQLFLRYGARWGMEALRGLVDVTPLEPGRHCGQFQCPCQYIKEHLQCKPRGKWKCLSILYWVLASERYDF